MRNKNYSGYNGYKDDMLRDLNAQMEQLKRENELLKKENAILESSFQQMKQIHDSVLEEYKNGIEETKEMRKHMQEVLHESMIAKKTYTDRVEYLLEQMKKNNTN